MPLFVAQVRRPILDGIGQMFITPQPLPISRLSYVATLCTAIHQPPPLSVPFQPYMTNCPHKKHRPRYLTIFPRLQAFSSLFRTITPFSFSTAFFFFCHPQPSISNGSSAFNESPVFFHLVSIYILTSRILY